MTDLLTLEDERHGFGEPFPLVDFFAECFATELGERVVACAPIVFGGLPIALDPAAVLESLERRIERALIDVEASVGDLLDAKSDAPPVHGFEGEGFQDEEVDAAAEGVGLLGVARGHVAALLLKSRGVLHVLL